MWGRPPAGRPAGFQPARAETAAPHWQDADWAYHHPVSRRRLQRVPYRLDARGVGPLTNEEIAAILRGADTMIAVGGRTQLVKLLKGSREASVLEHGLDRCPAYGFYRELAPDEVLRRIDWVIEHGFLNIEYFGRLPVLMFTEQGWEIEIETMAEELLRSFDTRLTAGAPYDFSDLKDRNRQMILLLLDKLEASGRPELIPLLQAWSEIDYAKVRARIAKVIRALHTPRDDQTPPAGGPAKQVPWREHTAS